MVTKANVIIATRNRADTLYWSLRTALNQTHPNMQVIVSDNCSKDRTREIVEGIGDPRIRYVNPGRSLSMSDNYEFALSHVEEGWVVQIGDDDGLLPNCLEWVIGAVEKSGLEALASRQCYYTWPAAPDPPPSRLSVPMGSGFETRSSARALRDSMRMYIRDLMPQTYTGGVIHHDLIRRIKEKTGRFYRAQIPDFYSGVAIVSSTKQYLYSRRPFAIAGRSSHSVGHALFTRQSSSFLDDDLIPFHHSLPMPPCGTLMFSMPAIWVECYLQTMDLHGNPLNLTPGDILLLVLQETIAGREEIEAWGKLYAEQNGLNYGEYARRAARRSPKRELYRRWGSFKNIWERYRVGVGSGTSLNNVYDASVAAHLITQTRPSRIRSHAKAALDGRRSPAA